MLKRSVLIVLWLIGLSGSALAAEDKQPAATPADPMAKVLPNVSFDSVQLDDALSFLQDVAPDFKAVIVRDKGVPDDYPTIKVKLKNVTLGQVWGVLQAANPDMEVQPVGENEGPTPIYLIRIKAPSSDAAPGVPQAAVRVYPLGPLVDAMTAKSEAAHEKDSLDHVLSLIKATLAQVPGRSEPVLQVHEETRTLIFKGSGEQQAALQEVLAALAPGSSTEVAGYKKNNDELQQQMELERKQADMRAKNLEADLAELHQRLAAEEKNSLDRASEAERMKVRLEEQTDRMNEMKKRLTDETDELIKLKDQAAHH